MRLALEHLADALSEDERVVDPDERSDLLTLAETMAIDARVSNGLRFCPQHRRVECHLPDAPSNRPDPWSPLGSMINARRAFIAFDVVVAVSSAILAVLLVHDSIGLTLMFAGMSVVSVVRLYLVSMRRVEL